MRGLSSFEKRLAKLEPDTDEKTAVYGWRAGDAQSVPMWEDDDYDGVVLLLLEYFAEERL